MLEGLGVVAGPTVSLGGGQDQGAVGSRPPWPNT
jgi:hypothetical protein